MRAPASNPLGNLDEVITSGVMRFMGTQDLAQYAQTGRRQGMTYVTFNNIQIEKNNKRE